MTFPVKRMNLPRLLASFLCLAFFVLLWTLIEYREVDVWTEEEARPVALPGRKTYALHRNLPTRLKGKELDFHQIFEPRLISFDGYPPTPIRNESNKLILLWNSWNGVKSTINYYFLLEGNTSFVSYGCPNSACTVTWDRSRLPDADAVLFNIRDLRDTKYSDIPSRPRHAQRQRWIAYIMEAPWLSHLDWSLLDGHFNWTMSYRHDSDVVVKYGFVGRRSEGEPTSKPGNPVPFSERKSVVWFVSDCKTDSRREEYVKELRKHIDVDVYGKCGDKTCYPSQSSVCYEDVLVNYKFYLSFENAICKDYVTEKFFNVLEYDVVPVVFGGAAYKKIAPPDSYIDATSYPDPGDLAALLKREGTDEKSYLKHFRWKETHRAYLHPWTCLLCDKLHEPITSFSPAKSNLKKWFVDDAQCKRWTDSKFVYAK